MADLRRSPNHAGVPPAPGERPETAAVRRGLLPDGVAPLERRPEPEGGGAGGVVRGGTKRRPPLVGGRERGGRSPAGRHGGSGSTGDGGQNDRRPEPAGPHRPGLLFGIARSTPGGGVPAPGP